MILIMIGAPGAGKGTQSCRLAQKYGLSHLSTGDIFRQAIKNQSTLGKRVLEYVKNGTLVPDELVCSLIEKEMMNKKNNNGYIFDGFPRTLGQAYLLNKLLLKHQLKIHSAIFLNTSSKKELINRLLERKEGRVDDNPIQIAKRLEIYETETQPIIEYYYKEKKLITINGIGKIDEVLNAICQRIDRKTLFFRTRSGSSVG